LCGTFEPVKFSCENFSQTNAYLDATSKDATIVLSWDASLINATLSCNFEYYSSDYDAVWVGDSFEVKINDPCLKPLTYSVTTSTGESVIEYGTGQD
jgi:hypothetical protein